MIVMKLTNEQLEKAKSAKSAEELLSLAKENCIALTEDEAKKYFARLHNGDELADDELNNVSGGGCGKRGDYTIMVCKSCSWSTKWSGHYDGAYYGPCPDCGAINIYSHVYVPEY